MVHVRSSKLHLPMMSRDRDIRVPSRSQARSFRVRRDPPRRECSLRTSRGHVRSHEGVCRGARSRSSGPVCSSRHCRRRSSASPVRSTIPGAASRHRALEERSSTSSTQPMLPHQCRGGDEDVRRENRRRMLERQEMLEDEEEEEESSKKTFGNRICKAAKMTSGILISVGLVLVFYVIITTIMGESSALDIFNFEYGTDDLLIHQENLTEPTFIMDLERRETGFGMHLESGSREIEYQGSETHNPDGIPNEEFKLLSEEEDMKETVQRDVDLVHKNETDAEGRSYIAYVPVPLSNEEETEEEEEKDTSSVHSNPLFVPVMIVPGDGKRNNFPQPQGRPHHVLPPVRPPLPHIPVQRAPITQRRITPLVPGGVPISVPTHSLLPHPQTTGSLPHMLPPGRGPISLPMIPTSTGSIQQPSRTPSSRPEANVSSNPESRHPYTISLSHSWGGGQSGHADQQMRGVSGLNGNLWNNGNIGSRENIMNGMHNTNDNGYRMNSMNGMNNGQGINRISIQSPGSTRLGIWNSLFEIMNNPSHSSRSENVASGSVTMGKSPGQHMRNMGESQGHFISSLGQGSSEIAGLGRMVPRPVFSPPSRTGSLPQSSSGIPREGPPTPRRVGDTGPNKLPLIRRMRPRLRPSSRMSGPLPKPLQHPRPLPRYRYNLPPIPPPVGMPIVPRRPPRPPRHRPPKDFQYPHDSTSIQDIIRYMNEKEQQGNRVRPPPGFTIGSQDHIIGPNPFRNSNSEGNVDFGNAPPSDFTNGGDNRFNNGGSYEFGGNYYNGENNYHNEGNNFFRGGGNNNVVSVGGGISGFNNGGSSNFIAGNHYGNSGGSGGNNFNSGSNSFNSGGNFNRDNINFSSGYSHGGNNVNNIGDNFSGGSNSFNGGGNNFNNEGYNIHSHDGSSLPPVKNTFDPNLGKSRPFSIMLDVYPMEDSSAAIGSRPFQTSISVPTSGGHIDFNNRYNSNDSGHSSGGRFSPEDEANKHEVVLHLNLYSKSPSPNRRSSGELAVGRNGAVSLEIPLTGTLSPLDIYKAVMSKARSQKPQAQVQVIPGKEESTHSHDEVEIELFDVEEGPQLLQAIEQGLRELNNHLPPQQQFIFPGEPMSVSDLHNAINGEGNSSTSSQESLGHRRPPASPPYDYNYDFEYYDYYDYYDYRDVDYVEPEQTVTAFPTTTTTSVEEGSHEELPTPCWHKVDEDYTGSAQ
ncbi:uncharacterized protein [Panulirus ornatus]|uniref:uncharacterized protein isoform X2 n=1 Tax=Panulirus ornatus TaxID=150431 RepID=UPI003A8597CE